MSTYSEGKGGMMMHELGYEEQQQPTDYKERYFELLKAVNDYLECDTASQSHKAMDKLYELATAMEQTNE